MNLVTRYSAFLDRRPFVSRLVTSTVLCLAGDMIVQTAIEKRSLSSLFMKADPKIKKFDVNRTLRAGFVGATAISLNLIGWYRKVLPFLCSRFANTFMFKRYPTLATTFLGISILYINHTGHFIYLLLFSD